MSRYVVRHELDCAEVLVYIYDTVNQMRIFDISPYTCIRVSEPSIIGRLLKITFEQKISAAINEMQQVADEYNKNNEIQKHKHVLAKQAYEKVVGIIHD